MPNGSDPGPESDDALRGSGAWPTSDDALRSSGAWPTAVFPAGAAGFAGPPPPGADTFPPPPPGGWPPGTDPRIAAAAWAAAARDAAVARAAGYYGSPMARLLDRLPPPPAPGGFGGRHRRRSLEHRDVSGGWLRAAVFGAMDGLVTNASLIAGASGAHAANHQIVLTGFAGLVAGAFSMATGEYISVTSQNEMTAAEVETERLELLHNPEAELAELTEVFIGKGVQPAIAAQVARQLSRDPKQALAIHAREELGVDPDDLPSPWTAAIASFSAFTVGALTPLAPYLVGVPKFSLSLVLAALAALLGGAVVAKAAKRSPLVGGLRQFALGGLATAMTFLVGQLVGAQVG
jgi:VIT1/CCC1 family predicted Fe2+/Mn2+ transporter